MHQGTKLGLPLRRENAGEKSEKASRPSSLPRREGKGGLLWPRFGSIFAQLNLQQCMSPTRWSKEKKISKSGKFPAERFAFAGRAKIRVERAGKARARFPGYPANFGRLDSRDFEYQVPGTAKCDF